MRVPANPPASRQPLVIGQMVQHPAGKIIGDHVHSEGQLSVVLKGTMGIRCKGGWWLAPAGRGIWIPSGMEHSAIYSERASFVLLKVTPLAGALPPSVRSIGVSDFLKELSIEIARPAAHQVNDDGALISALIVRRLCDAKATPMLFLPSGNDPRVLRITEFLRSNPANTASFDKLAKMAGSSRRTLSRLFLADTGMTFVRWRNHLRIVTAIDKLVRHVPIAQIAIELGFNSQSSFTTMFTRTMGEPPGRYLRDDTTP